MCGFRPSLYIFNSFFFMYVWIWWREDNVVVRMPITKSGKKNTHNSKPWPRQIDNSILWFPSFARRIIENMNKVLIGHICQCFLLSGAWVDFVMRKLTILFQREKKWWIYVTENFFFIAQKVIWIDEAHLMKMKTADIKSESEMWSRSECVLNFKLACKEKKKK